MRAPRSDAAQTRRRLLDAVESLLLSGRTDFSLPEAAHEAGVSVASAYRHFESPLQLRTAYHESKIRELVASFEELAARERGVTLFHSICHAWVRVSLPWAPAVARTRSYEGFLERVREHEPITTAIHDVLSQTLRALVADGVVPEQDVDYATLAWTTMFDERLLVDLSATKGWAPEVIAETLGAHVLAVLRTPMPTRRGEAAG